ncbi:MAG: hypothetical protein ABR606_09505 [Vicinamibacterales bacterium]
MRALLDQLHASTDSAPNAADTSLNHNTALGCRTAEVAASLLAQLVDLEEKSFSDMSESEFETLATRYTAFVAELEPRTATEALLAVQMVGCQRAAMKFLGRATLPDQPMPGADANVLRATRLMRLFIEQADMMLRLKGKAGQQRVIVERVTVEHGGQAVVGMVETGGKGTSDNDRG